MRKEKENIEKVWKLIDRDEIVNLALEMGNIHAPSGDEIEMSDYVFNWMSQNEFNPLRQTVFPGRDNVVGIYRGTGDGKSLIFNSHLDSDVGVAGEKLGTRESDLISGKKLAWIEKDRVFGKTVLNDRGPMSCFLIAAKAVKDSGIRLKGDLILTTVVGEIGMAPVDEYQTTAYIGKGIGTRHLVTHGVFADFAIVAETTDFGITWTEAGVCYVKITVKGQTMYTPRSTRPVNIKEHPNAIVKMAHIIQAIEKWAKVYEQDNRYPFGAGVVVPKVNVGAIRGGFPPKPSKTADRCSIYVDIRIPPFADNSKALKEIKGVIKELGIKADFEPYLFRKGYEGKNVEPLIESIEKAHIKVYGKGTPPVPTSVTSMWRDINIFNEVGIPSLTFGPPRRRLESGDGEGKRYMTIDDLVNTAKIYSSVILDICGYD